MTALTCQNADRGIVTNLRLDSPPRFQSSCAPPMKHPGERWTPENIALRAGSRRTELGFRPVHLPRPLTVSNNHPALRPSFP